MKEIESIPENENYIVDSCGWIEYFAEGPLADDFAKYIDRADPEFYFTPTIVIYEVYRKFLTVYSEEDAIKAIAHIKFNTTIIDLTETIAMNAAKISKKRKIPMADSIIMASSDHCGSTVITSDSDFKGMDGVIYFSK